MLKKYLEKRRTEKERIKARRKEIGIFREYFELISETLIFVFFVMTFLLQSFVIPTGSMKDTLLVGDHLLVDKVSYSRRYFDWEKYLLPQEDIERGMIVTFKSPPDMGKEYVKRVIGVPGDKIRVKDRKVYINGNLLNESYACFKEPDSVWDRDNFPLPEEPYLAFRGRFPKFFFKFIGFVRDSDDGKVFQVPEGHYFCMGDNRDNSWDSRYFGPVPAEYIIGKPWRIYWSYSSESSDYMTTGAAHKIKDLFSTVTNFFTKTRWTRTLQKVI